MMMYAGRVYRLFVRAYALSFYRLCRESRAGVGGRSILVHLYEYDIHIVQKLRVCVCARRGARREEFVFFFLFFPFKRGKLGGVESFLIEFFINRRSMTIKK